MAERALAIWNKYKDAPFNISMWDVDESEAIGKLASLICSKVGAYLSIIPSRYIQLEWIKSALLRDPWAIKYVPVNLRVHPEIWQFALSRHGYSLMLIPEDLRTKEMCCVVTSTNHWDLRHIPEKFQTREMYIKAVLMNDDFLQWIPNLEHCSNIDIMIIAAKRFRRRSCLPRKYRHAIMSIISSGVFHDAGLDFSYDVEAKFSSRKSLLVHYFGI